MSGCNCAPLPAGYPNSLLVISTNKAQIIIPDQIGPSSDAVTNEKVVYEFTDEVNKELTTAQAVTIDRSQKDSYTVFVTIGGAYSFRRTALLNTQSTILDARPDFRITKGLFVYNGRTFIVTSKGVWVASGYDPNTYEAKKTSGSFLTDIKYSGHSIYRKGDDIPWDQVISVTNSGDFAYISLYNPTPYNVTTLFKVNLSNTDFWQFEYVAFGFDSGVGSKVLRCDTKLAGTDTDLFAITINNDVWHLNPSASPVDFEHPKLAGDGSWKYITFATGYKTAILSRSYHSGKLWYVDVSTIGDGNQHALASGFSGNKDSKVLVMGLGLKVDDYKK